LITSGGIAHISGGDKVGAFHVGQNYTILKEHRQDECEKISKSLLSVERIVIVK
jgi:hypothetical protein